MRQRRLIFTLFGLWIGLSSVPGFGIGCGPIVWENATYELATQSPFKTVNRDLAKHAVERRGFVTVPLDYNRPDGMKIDIFYRLIPTLGGSVDDASKPIVVVVNGGPGAGSHNYRPLEFNYDDRSGAEKIEPPDRILNLERHVRVLLIDQRGTDGLSAPLDLDNPSLRPEVIAKYFDSDDMARDHAQVINAVIPASERFYMINQSFGGQIGLKYLEIASARMPNGMVFSSSALPFLDPYKAHLERRQSQLDLQYSLVNKHPDAPERFDALRTRLSSLFMEPKLINRLWKMLGRGQGWEQKLLAHVELLTTCSEAKLRAEFEKPSSGVTLLNYVLSSAAFSAGYTDRTLPLATQRALPMPEWMLDEDWTLQQIGNDGTWRDEWVGRVDQTPPPGTDFGTPASVHKLLRRTNCLFTVGVGDALVAPTTSMEAIEILRDPADPARILSLNLPGGHAAIFSPAGAATLTRWIQTIP